MSRSEGLASYCFFSGFPIFKYRCKTFVRLIISFCSRVAKAEARLTQEPEVPGSILGSATLLSFLLPLIQVGQLSVCALSAGLPLRLILA